MQLLILLSNYLLKMKKIITLTLLTFSVLSFLFLFNIQSSFAANTEDTIKDNPLTNTPNMDEYHVPNPGNLPFVHDEEVAYISNEDVETGRYGTIRNDSAYIAFGLAIEFGIKSLIKLVGVMCMFGVTSGLVKLVIAHGNEEVHKKGIDMILWSLVGLVLSLTAHALVTGLMQLLTGVGTINI